jgi:hypothetical protein
MVSVFGFKQRNLLMLKWLYMSLHKKLGLSNKKTQNDEEANLKLTKGELEALLIGLGEASFKGKQVESVFKLAMKIQNEIKKLS